MIKVALDAMGGDYAPSVCIEGAVNAVKKNPNIHVVLCGPEAEVKASLEKIGYTGNQISVVDAPDRILWLWMNILSWWSRRSNILAW